MRRVQRHERYEKRPVRPYRQASPSPARHRPGARSARRMGDPRMIPQTVFFLRGVFAMRMGNRTSRLNVEILEDRCTPSTLAAFDLANPDSGPFPSDRFTVADSSQLTAGGSIF